MSLIVAIPIQYASIKVHVDKGRHWSVLEHVLLQSICAEPRSAMQLSKAGSIPIRLVIEALINLMRAGWADIRQAGDHMVFAATTGGEHNVKLDTLPPVTRPQTKQTKFAIEQVTGSILRWREIVFAPDRSPRLDLSGVVRMHASANLPLRSQTEIIETLLEDDESYRAAEMGSEKPGSGWALVTVTGKKLLGLSRTAPSSLQRQVRAAARREENSGIDVTMESGAEREPNALTTQMTSLSFSVQDLILGGPSHRSMFEEMLLRARSMVIIHSTFMSIAALDWMFPAICEAVRDRAVAVHLFYGKEDRLGQPSPTSIAIEHLKNRLKEERLTAMVHLHQFSTRSHAKILIADDGYGTFEAVIGSCNWLSTPFKLFEASIRLKDPHAVAEVISGLAQMAFEATGRDDGIALDLAGLAVNLRRQPSSRGRSEGRIVLGPQHAQIIDIARDTAKQRIVLGSHRLGASAETLSLIPIRAAVRENNIESIVYFGIANETDVLLPSSKPANDAADTGVRMIENDLIHAKFLAWDDDDVLITSHNLLSADPITTWSEVGFHIHSAGIAKRLIDQLKEQFDG